MDCAAYRAGMSWNPQLRGAPPHRQTLRLRARRRPPAGLLVAHGDGDRLVTSLAANAAIAFTRRGQRTSARCHGVWFGRLGVSGATVMTSPFAAVILRPVVWLSGRESDDDCSPHLRRRHRFDFRAGADRVPLVMIGLSPAKHLRAEAHCSSRRVFRTASASAPSVEERDVLAAAAGVGLAFLQAASGARVPRVAVLSAIGCQQIYVGGDPGTTGRSRHRPCRCSSCCIGVSRDLIQTATRARLPGRWRYAGECALAALVLVGLLRCDFRFLREIALRQTPYQVTDTDNEYVALAIRHLTGRTRQSASSGPARSHYRPPPAVDRPARQSDRYIARRAPDLSGRVAWNGMKSVLGHNKDHLDYDQRRLIIRCRCSVGDEGSPVSVRVPGRRRATKERLAEGLLRRSRMSAGCGRSRRRTGEHAVRIKTSAPRLTVRYARRHCTTDATAVPAPSDHRKAVDEAGDVVAAGRARRLRRQRCYGTCSHTPPSLSPVLVAGLLL